MTPTFKFPALLLSVRKANYLNRWVVFCLDSILSQDTSMCEIILVDDGSIDASKDICEAYSLMHANIHVIHQNNKGLSGARNTGIKEAHGDYIWFIDGDDYISNDAVQIILSRLQSQRDVYIIDHINIFQNRGTKYVISAPDEETNFGIEYLKRNGAIQAWVSICNRQFLFQEKIFFSEGIYHEDFEFSIRLYALAKTVEHIQFALYYYICDRDGSIMNQQTSKSAIGYASSAPLIYRFLEEQKLSSYVLEEVCKVVAIGVTFSILRTKKLPQKDLEEVVSFYKKNLKFICFFLTHSTMKHFILGCMLRINIELSFFVYNMIKK